MPLDEEPKPPDKPPPVETDARFPSGPWEGFFLQPTMRKGRSWMELILTFRAGVVQGEGRDWVGSFLVRGRYTLDDGKCWWSKRYVGKHDVAYTGYNEGKGIWGTWEMKEYAWRGGFHIWPVGMGDPSKPKLAEAVDVSQADTVEIPTEPLPVGAGAE
jgi:hypothetical protein